MESSGCDFDGVQHFNRCRSCGKAFPQPSALSNHLRSCKQARNRLHNALAGARRIWSEGQGVAKRLKLTHTSDGQGTASMNGDINVNIQGPQDVIVSFIVSNYSSS